MQSTQRTAQTEAKRFQCDAEQSKDGQGVTCMSQ